MKSSRRAFLKASAATALTGASLGSAQKTGAEPNSAGKGPKLGCQSGPYDSKHFAFLARYGVRNICAFPNIDDASRTYPTVAELNRLLELADHWGLHVDMTGSTLLGSTNVDVEKHPAIMLGEGPQRDRDIEAFQKLIVNCAAAGIPAIKYNMSILGVLRNTRQPGRGDAVYSGWNESEVKPHEKLTRAGMVSESAFWDRISYFLERVVPVANEYRVRLACHPQDPGVGPAGYRGVHRVLGSVEGLKRFVALQESPYHGLNFCQGTIASDLERPAEEIFDVIRYFGKRKKIFNVHLRNVRGRRGHFVETYPDDGDVDMLQAVRVYREVGYEGMLMPDHVPSAAAEKQGIEYAYNYGLDGSNEDGHLESFAFSYGYIRGLIQATA